LVCSHRQRFAAAAENKLDSDRIYVNIDEFSVSGRVEPYVLPLNSLFYLFILWGRPLYGKLSDIFGRKPCLIFAYSIFVLGCLFCGLARTMNELICARAFSGIGGGGMTTCVFFEMA